MSQPTFPRPTPEGPPAEALPYPILRRVSSPRGVALRCTAHAGASEGEKAGPPGVLRGRFRADVSGEPVDQEGRLPPIPGAERPDSLDQHEPSLFVGLHLLKPTVSLGVTCAVVYTCGRDDGRIAPTHCALIDGRLGGRWSRYQVCRTPPAEARSARSGLAAGSRRVSTAALGGFLRSRTTQR